MRYTKEDIPKIPLTEFMAALGEKPVRKMEDLILYYAPQRDDPEPMLVVDTNTNRWYDHATDESGDIIDLAALKMNPNVYNDPRDFILKYMNEFEVGKEMAAMARRAVEPTVINLDIKKLSLTDFLSAIGCEPLKKEGNLLIYPAPYDDERKPTMLVDTSTNRWRDTKSGAYGGIYDLAYELTGSCNMSELNLYINGQMQGFKKESRAAKMPNSPKVERPESPKPKRKMRF